MHFEHIQPRAVSLYLHIPFCDHKCAYCDFNSYAGQDSLIPAYVEALEEELALWSPILDGVPVRTVFFGGGTPSLLSSDQISRLLQGAKRHFAVEADAEITLEANPGTVDLEKLSGFRDAGVNRLSLGVQSFDDRQLRLLDRIHDASQAEAAYASARTAGFENVNLDLMFGLQQQDLDGWQRNLARAIALRPEHLSLYALTVEPNTALGAQVARGLAPEPDPDLQADMYEAAAAAMSAAGYRQYEISNWSLPGMSGRHNLTYWHNEPYLGAGAGAHSCLHGRRFSLPRSPAGYIERVLSAAGGPPHLLDVQRLTKLVDAADTLILGLRLNEGIDCGAFARRYGVEPIDLAGVALQELQGYGLLEHGPERLGLTERGRLLSNEVFLRLLPDALDSPADWDGGAFVDTASLPFLP